MFSSTVLLISEMRMHSVQTELQYLYLFKCLLTLTRKHKLLPPDIMPMFEKFEKDYQDIIDAKMNEDAPEAYAPLIPMAPPPHQ